MANRTTVDGSRGAPPKAPVLLLMDSPRKANAPRGAWPTESYGGEEKEKDEEEEGEEDHTKAASQVRRPSPTADAQAVARAVATNGPSSSDSLGRLLVDMTAQVQAERSKRHDVEARNQSLLLEIEQLQREVLELKTSQEQHTRRRASGDWDAATRADHYEPAAAREGNAELWWRELQDAKSALAQAQADAHRRALEVLELNACISMQHDELKALRASEGDARFALSRAEQQSKDVVQQHTLLLQETQLLRDDVVHLNHEIGKRGLHFKALLDKWSDAQAQTEHGEREHRAMLDKMKELRAKHELLQHELETLRDDRESLQHHVNHLKGACAAKTAESKAFQAYGTNARDHLQAQHGMLQRHAIFRRKVHHIARDSVVAIKHLKSTLATVRAPLVAIQADFKMFLKNLQAPVLTLVARSRRFAETAQIEYAPLKKELVKAELTRRHLHEQLWRARRNALLVCQIRNVAVSASATVSASASASTSMTDAILGMADPLTTAVSAADALGAATRPLPVRTLRANYATAELLLRETDRDTVTVQCDAVFSDRSRGAGCWNNYESVLPVLQSVLDGFNACVTTFDGLLPLKLDISASASASASANAAETMGVPELVLTQLFELLQAHGAHFHRVKLTISFLGVYNEAIYDLLGLDPHSAAANGTAATAQSMSSIVVLEVQNAEEALLVLRGGAENLEAAHDLRLLDKFLIHKVVTVCMVHENLLLTTASAAATKSKLQIVELATGPPETADVAAAANAADWEDRSKVKAHVAMENGVQALLTTLADVRVAADGGSASASSASSVSAGTGGVFVRYHSSKLTVLLQDTIKATAKFLGVAVLPGAVVASASASATSTASASAPPLLDPRCAQVTRWMFHLRNAVGSVAGASTGAHGTTDRSVEGFINRFTQSQADGSGGGGRSGGGGGAAALAFSSSELLEKRAQANARGSLRWEKEYDGMKRRYGDLAAFTTSFYQPRELFAHSASLCSGDAPTHEDRASRAASPRRATASTTIVEELTDVVLRPHELLVACSGADTSATGAGAALLPPPALLRAKQTKRRPTVKSRVPGHRNGGKTETGDKPKRRATTAPAAALMVGESAADTVLTTLAPRHGTTTAKATPMVKLRRETASSSLKKAIASRTTLVSSAAVSVSVRVRRAASASASAGAVSSATLTRLQQRKSPFK